MPRYRSKIAAAVHEAMQDAYDVGLLDKKTMGEFDEVVLDFGQSLLTCADQERSESARA